MKILLVNGSPHEHCCTRAALDEIAKELSAHRGVTTYHIGM
jgi:multimeric flavodoxin WrbA